MGSVAGSNRVALPDDGQAWPSTDAGSDDAADRLHVAVVCAVDPAMEDTLYEVESMRRFGGLDLTDDAMSDETTILKFRHLLEKRVLTRQMMSIINDTLEQRGLRLNGGTMVDGTIIHARPSTKNRDK